MSSGKSLVVSKSNALARAGNNLELIEAKVIEYCLSTLYKDDVVTEDTLFEVDIEVMGEYFGLLPSNAYRELKKVFENILDKKVTFPTLSGEETVITHWITSVIYNDRCNGLKLRFSKDIVPHISKEMLKKNFTMYKLEDVAGFKCKHSVILYNFWKSYAHDKAKWQTPTISIEDLRKMLYVGEEEYVLWGTFKKMILKSQDEIEKRGLKVEMIEKKKGRKVEEVMWSLG